ncbi:unnamed protein product, partial [Meganyctiphanes norvegica]
HPSAGKLRKFLKCVVCEDKVVQDSVEKVSAACGTCIGFEKPHPLPVVAMPLITTFNETMAMDLKNWFYVYFLVIVDLATNFCSAMVIYIKLSDAVVTSFFYRLNI